MSASGMWSMTALRRLVRHLDLAIVVVDRRLFVRRYTPAARRLTNLTPGDIGQPLSRRRWNVELDGLEERVRECVRRLRTSILDVRDDAGRWYTLSIRPNRSPRGRVDGAVLMLSEAPAFPESFGLLSGRLLHLQDEERRRIARELHDSTAQRLAAVSMNLDLLSRALADGSHEARRTLAESRALLDACAHEIRTLTDLLHPPVLNYRGLAAAVRSYASGFSRQSGIRIDTRVPELGRLPPHVEQALYRIVQESLTNIRRHANSPTASITATRRGGGVTLVVRDGGRGFVPEPSDPRARHSQRRTGVGIHSMRERMRELGGEFAITSGPTGTTVRVRAPLREASH
jgi:two-component system, NarL family, sensor kinase